MAVGLEGTHVQLLGQGEGLVIVGFGLCDLGGGGVGMDGTKLAQREGLIGALLVLPGQGKRLVRVLPGLSAVSRQTADLTEPCDSGCMTSQRTRVDNFPDRLLQQRAPLREVPLQCIGRAQARRDHSQIGPAVKGTTEGQSLVEHLDSILQVSFGEV